MGPPPGWYPDPWQAVPWRWWDGTQWTGHWSPGPTPVVQTVSPAELQHAHAKEEKTWRWARLALGAVLIVLVGQWISDIWVSHTFRHLWSQIQVSNGNTQVTQIHGFSPATGLYFDLLYVAGAAVAIVFFIWQHSAATVARGLGYPSRTSPAYGVGSWFIPVINLWFPYWALSDTLPPDHPMRGRCLLAWLSYLGALLVGTTTLFVALASTAAAVVVMIISGALAVVAVGLGAQLITAVHEDHRRAAGQSR